MCCPDRDQSGQKVPIIMKDLTNNCDFADHCDPSATEEEIGLALARKSCPNEKCQILFDLQKIREPKFQSRNLLI